MDEAWNRTHELRSRQISINQEGIGRWNGCSDDEQLTDVGGERFGAPPPVGSREFVVSWQHTGQQRIALVGRSRPLDPVSAHRPLTPAGNKTTVPLASIVLDQHATAVGGHDPARFRRTMPTPGGGDARRDITQAKALS